jgi:predicted nucleic acid-binding Zn ribbon protein
MDVRIIYRTCPTCGASFGQPDDPGRKRRFCSDACKQAAYRARKRARDQARQRAEEEAAHRAREEQARRARDRARRTPPHAGTSRSGPFCSACGGPRGPHTLHHDQAAHDRARRRYDGLHAKAASTGFPEEAAACRSKAEQLRAKYGL